MNSFFSLETEDVLFPTASPISRIEYPLKIMDSIRESGIKNNYFLLEDKASVVSFYAAFHREPVPHTPPRSTSAFLAFHRSSRCFAVAVRGRATPCEAGDAARRQRQREGYPIHVAFAEAAAGCRDFTARRR
jgi:hypothetical protein